MKSITSFVLKFLRTFDSPSFTSIFSNYISLLHFAHCLFLSSLSIANNDKVSFKPDNCSRDGELVLYTVGENRMTYKAYELRSPFGNSKF